MSYFSLPQLRRGEWGWTQVTRTSFSDGSTAGATWPFLTLEILLPREPNSAVGR